jgi:hypothetical protein
MDGPAMMMVADHSRFAHVRMLQGSQKELE